MEKKFRLVFAKGFPDPETVPVYEYYETKEEAKKMLKVYGSKGKFQSDQHPIPGLRSVAAIEELIDGEWYFSN